MQDDIDYVGMVISEDAAERAGRAYTPRSNSHTEEHVSFSDYDALRQQLADVTAERDNLKAALKFYADREHYHFESGNWDTVSGEPLNSLWCGDEPDYIEDGTVARNALNKPAGVQA